MLVDQCCNFFRVLLWDGACHVSLFKIIENHLKLIEVPQGHPPTSFVEVYDNCLASSSGDSYCRIIFWRRARASDPDLFSLICIADGNILYVHARNRS